MDENKEKIACLHWIWRIYLLSRISKHGENGISKNTEKQRKGNNILMTQRYNTSLEIFSYGKQFNIFSRKQDSRGQWNGGCVLHALNPSPDSGKRTPWENGNSWHSPTWWCTLKCLPLRPIGVCHSSAHTDWVWVSTHFRDHQLDFFFKDSMDVRRQ